MKILFLQNIQDSIGGVTIVNISLAKAFLNHGEEVYIYSVRNTENAQKVEYPKEIQTKLINKTEIWSCPRYNEAIKDLKELNIKEGIGKILKRKQYDKLLINDYNKLKTEILKLNPDIIINSHYELLKAIPKEYLKKTINHYHTSFTQLLKNKSQLKFLKKYSNKILKYVWLTEESCKLAKQNGIENSITIYNPIRFSSEEISNVRDNKTAIFLGRISKEKRLDLAVDMFSEVVKKFKCDEWTFKIYAVGELDCKLKKKIEENKSIFFMGKTDNPKEVLLQSGIMLLTSEFEGLPLTVLEANECGVPVISFNFGETAKEVIKNNTGILVEQNNKEEYQNKLVEIMENEETREQLSIEAKRFAKNFKIDEIQNQWYKLFEKVKR